MKKNIIIRTMKKDDFKDASILMSFAFGSKLPSLSNLSTTEMADFMLAGQIFNANSLREYYVACYDNKVIGIMHLDCSDYKKNKKYTKLDKKYFIHKYGLLKSVLAGISLLLLYYPSKKDEMLLDFIAVHPEHRGLGVGSQLLEYGESIANSKKDIKSYTLFVIDKNKAAKKLYERKGFITIKSKTKYISRFFTGVKKYHKMSKEL